MAEERDQFVREDISEQDMPEQQQEDPKEKEENLKRRQKEVDDYNRRVLTVDPVFKEKMFLGHEIIVRLFMDDILLWQKLGENDYVPVRNRNDKTIELKESGRTEKIENPLPYLMKGVVCAVPHHLWDKDFPDDMKEYETVQPLRVVELKSLDLDSMRYYPNPWLTEEIIDAQDAVAGNAFKRYEGYVCVHMGMVQAVDPRYDNLTKFGKQSIYQYGDWHLKNEKDNG